MVRAVRIAVAPYPGPDVVAFLPALVKDREVRHLGVFYVQVGAVVQLRIVYRFECIGGGGVLKGGGSFIALRRFEGVKGGRIGRRDSFIARASCYWS